MGLPAPGNALILVKYGTTRFLTNQNRTMVIRIMDGAWSLWCLVGCLLLVGSSFSLVRADETSPVVGELLEPNEYGSISPEDLCQSLCGECQCRGRLVSENQCQCSCDFAVDSAGGQQCTLKVQQLCSKMDVQCVFNGTEEAYVREPRGCHTMSCYEKEMHHDEGGYDGYEHGGEGYGYDEGYGHGVKQLVCCKDKHKHKEKKHKHKKHKKHEKHMKFHVVIKGKIPEHSCHGGHEEGEHYEGYEDHGGYRAAPDRPQMNPAHMPMDVAVWTNRQKQAKKHPFRRPVHHHQQPSHHRPASHYGRPPSYGPPPPPYPVDSRAKSADSPSPEPRPEPMHHPQDTQPPSPQQGPPPPPPQPTPPAEPESPPVTPFPQHQLTPPPNLYDGAPVGPKPAPQNSNQEPPKHHSFTPPSPPSPPSPPVRPPMITVDPPPRRIDSSRSFDEPSHSSCQFDSYDFNYYHPPPPPPPPPSSYRSFSSSYVPSYPTSHYHPHDQYDTPEYYPEKPVEYSKYDDNSNEHRAYQSSHGVHPLSDNEVEDWPEYPPRYPSDMHMYNQIISRQIIEVDTALGYTDKPFQPTPRPLRDEFEPPTAEVGPILFESAGPADKNYEMYPVPTPPPEAFIPAVPAPPTVPFEFADPESGPILFPPNSEEALYPQPTPPPHYLLAKEAGSMSSFGFEHQQQQQQFQQHPWGPTFDGGSSWGYSRSAAGPSQFHSGSSRSSAPCSRRYQ